MDQKIREQLQEVKGHIERMERQSKFLLDIIKEIIPYLPQKKAEEILKKMEYFLKILERR